MLPFLSFFSTCKCPLFFLLFSVFLFRFHAFITSFFHFVLSFKASIFSYSFSSFLNLISFIFPFFIFYLLSFAVSHLFLEHFLFLYLNSNYLFIFQYFSVFFRFFSFRLYYSLVICFINFAFFSLPFRFTLPISTLHYFHDVDELKRCITHTDSVDCHSHYDCKNSNERLRKPTHPAVIGQEEYQCLLLRKREI